MSAIEDILKVLDRWSEWKRIRETPKQLEALEKRVAELELRLQRAPGAACPSCGELAFHVHKSTEPAPRRGTLHRTGMREHHWLCGKCGYEDIRPSLA